MDLLSFVVLAILFRETIGGDFTISDDKTDWTTASKQCTLATPDLIFSPDKITVEIDESIADEVWVGYKQATTVFEYYGCAEKDNALPTPSKRSDPRQCLLSCDADKIIGIFGNECSCFEKNATSNIKQTMLPYCTKECDNLKGIVCGGNSRNASGTTYMTLYRPVEADFSSVGEIKKDWNCMFYDHSGLNWSDCSKSNEVICEKGETVWIEHDTISKRVYRDWANAAVRCFTNDTRPSTYKKTKYVHTVDSTAPLWTGIARSQKIYKYTNGPNHMGQSVEYVYLKKTLNGIVLRVANVTDIKKSLCVNVSSSANVGAIVGATLSVVVVIVVVVVVVLFLRKRGFQLPTFKKGKQTTNKAHNNNAYGISQPVEILQSTYHTDQNEYADIDLTTTIDNEARNGKQKDAQDSSDYAHSHFVLEQPEEEPYDSTKAGDKKSDPNTYNPYNKLSFEESSNYDHVDAGNAQVGNAGRKVSDSENTYNTTSFGNSYLKTSCSESDKDTYNHTNAPMGLRTSVNDYDAI